MNDRQAEALVRPRDLAAALGAADLVVVDCRHSLAVARDASDAGRAAWRSGHVPGAVHAHLDDDLSGAGVAGQGRHPWPSADAFAARLGAWGISPRSRVVAYDDSDGAFAARLWFLLRALGHREVAVLDGGWAHWQAAGLPVDAALPQPPPARYPAAFDAARLVDAAGVQTHLANGGLLLDARAAARFRGEVEPLDPVAGHVPGAVNRPYAENLEDGRFKPAARLREEFDALLGGRPAADVVAMCGSGVTACHHLLAMAQAGLPGARLYTGSWSGWIADPVRPVATGG